MSTVEYVVIALFVASLAVVVLVNRSLRGDRVHARFKPALPGSDAAAAAEAFVSSLPTPAGPRLTIRPAQDGDGAEIFDAVDHEIAYWMGWTPDQLANKRDWRSTSGRLLRTSGYLPLIHNETGRIVGTATVADVDLKAGIGELGIWLGGTDRGAGLGLEALELALDCLHQGGLDLVRMQIAVNNKPMRRIAEQAGAHEGLELEAVLPNAIAMDSIIYYHLANSEPDLMDEGAEDDGLVLDLTSQDVASQE